MMSHRTATATCQQEQSQSKANSLLHLSANIAKLDTTLSIVIQNKDQAQSSRKQWEQQQAMNQQQQNNRLRTDSTGYLLLLEHV